MGSQLRSGHSSGHSEKRSDSGCEGKKGEQIGGKKSRVQLRGEEEAGRRNSVELHTALFPAMVLRSFKNYGCLLMNKIGRSTHGNTIQL